MFWSGGDWWWRKRDPSEASVPEELAAQREADCTARWVRYFRCLDTNGDRRVDFHDHVAASARLASTFDLHGLGGHYKKRLRRSQHLWLLGVGQDVGAVDERQFCANLATQAATDPRGFVRCLDAMAVALAEVADQDGDGRVENTEFRALLDAGFGVPEAEADLAFEHLDLDGSGYLEHGEIRQAVRDYFTPGPRERPGNWLFGPPPWLRPAERERAGAD
ncbi:EF-hand domain-containing protein [Streptomyces sp. NPDC001941]|uniref:EF-hand domain-containing protein n=1 Tax=Streptomyces sp. NPDC001941 TaxID=3154659 RepID=UPI003328CBAB